MGHSVDGIDQDKSGVSIQHSFLDLINNILFGLTFDPAVDGFPSSLTLAKV